MKIENCFYFVAIICYFGVLFEDVEWWLCMHEKQINQDLFFQISSPYFYTKFPIDLYGIGLGLMGFSCVDGATAMLWNNLNNRLLRSQNKIIESMTKSSKTLTLSSDFCSG